ncbi:7719_t:CDS:2, partial [Funneliformis geosporum]
VEGKFLTLEFIHKIILSDTDKATLKDLKETTIPKQRKGVEIAQNIDGAGLIGHFITKKVLGMFSDNKE